LIDGEGSAPRSRRSRDGKTFRVNQELRHQDGTLGAEITNVGGVLDLNERRLAAERGEHWRSVTTSPALLGL
jgi:acyl-CoA thioester hydrolase